MAAEPQGKDRESGRSKLNLRDLPLVAFAMACGHIDRQYGVQKRDLVFCEQCQATRTVSRIISA